MTTSLTAAGFLFDMDGTLVDSTAVVEAVWGELAARYGLDLRTVLAYSHGRQSRSSVGHLLGDRPADEREEIVRWIAVEEERRLDGVVEIPGATALLDRLGELGAPVALVTSAHLALARARMGAAGVPMPAVTVTAEDVSRSKPDPQGYQLGAARLGLTPEQCLAFEDAPAGIAAVIASGATLVSVHGADSAVAPAPPAAARLHLQDYADVRVAAVGDGTFTLTAG